MVPSSDMIEAGRKFASDLRRIREKRDISVETVVERTKASPDILEAFEENALVEHPLYNRVYLRSFVRTYAAAVEIDADLALEAAEALLEGRYDGSLAARYLDEDPRPGTADTREDVADEREGGVDAELADASPSPEETPEVAGRSPESGATKDPVSPTTSPKPVSGPDVMQAFESAPGDAWTGRLKWIIPGVAVVVILLILWLRPRDESRTPVPPPPLEAVTPMPIDTSAALSVPPRVVLPDTMLVWVVAEGDALDPVRLRVDADQRRPYWIEYGDSMAFRVVGRISIEREMEHVALSVGGYRLPTDRSDPDEPIIYSRVRIQETLDSLRMIQ